LPGIKKGGINAWLFLLMIAKKLIPIDFSYHNSLLLNNLDERAIESQGSIIIIAVNRLMNKKLLALNSENSNPLFSK